MAGQLVQSAPFFPGPTTKRPRSRLRRLIVALLIAGGGLALLAIVALVMMFGYAMAKCPPKDFPVYADAQETDFNYAVADGSSDCTVGWESGATPDQVATFYDGGLSSGPWQLVSKDEQSGVWSFQRRDDSSTVGRMRFLPHEKQTRIEMEVMTGQFPAGQ